MSYVSAMDTIYIRGFYDKENFVVNLGCNNKFIVQMYKELTI